MTQPLVIVTWNDAAGSATLEYDAARDHKPTVMHTVGWLMKRDAVGISIACESFVEEGRQRHRGVTFIPAGMVVKVQKITSRKIA